MTTTPPAFDDIAYTPNDKDRVVVIDTVYHQSVNEEPTCIDSRYSRHLETQEQPYVRKLTATEEWQPIDCGWIKRTSLLMLINQEGKFHSTIPTEEERKVVEQKVIELAYKHWEPGHWVIRPGESFRGCPNNLEDLQIRCRSGDAKYTLSLFPV